MKSHAQYIEELSIKNPRIECMGQYSGATTKILHRCKTCGHEWLMRPTCLVKNSPQGCPHCGAVKAGLSRANYTTDSFNEKLSLINSDIKLISKFNRTHTKSLFQCSRCGNQWYAMPYSVLAGHGCPRCAKSGTSFMEQVFLLAFQQALGKEKVLSRDRTAIGKELDIYIPSCCAAIEPGSWALHKNRLSIDKEKRELCDAVNIRLIIIYDVFPNSFKRPFEKDCLLFQGDFNREDHAILWKYVEECFNLLEIKFCISHAEKLLIEAQAYANSKSLTHDTFIARMNAIHPNIRVIGKYENANKRILCHCNVCNREWQAVPANLLSGDGCWDCGRKAIGDKLKKGFDDFVSEVHRIDPEIDIDPNTYSGTHSYVTAHCNRCGKTWVVLARTLTRSNPSGCPICSAESIRLKYETRYLESLRNSKPYISCLEPYQTRSTKISHRCSICGHIWSTTPACVLKSRYGCPNWKKHNFS